MKVAIYSRVSDDKKKSDGERRQDVTRQTDLIEDFIRKDFVTNPQDMEIKVYVDDGKSAFTDDLNQRPAFKQLIDDCRRHFVERIYIEDMSRFSRRLDVGLPILKRLGDLNIHLISLREGELGVTESKDWLRSSMLLMFAEWDSRVKSEKVKSGMQKAKNLGKCIHRKKGGSKTR